MRFLTVLLSCAIALSVLRPAHADRSAGESAARALFERNIAAIEARDAESYLSCYLDAPWLVRNGFEGVALGYDELAAGVGDDTWPDEFRADELQVFGIADGVVYGQYRYHVRYGDDVQEGISERVFVRTDGGWRIAVTTAFGAPDGALPPLDDEDGSQ